MTELEKEVKDIAQARKLLIELCHAVFCVADYDDYQAIKVMVDKCDDRSRKARREIRNINRTNNKDTQ